MLRLSVKGTDEVMKPIAVSRSKIDSYTIINHPFMHLPLQLETQSAMKCDNRFN